jgi:hypothetical protein
MRFIVSSFAFRPLKSHLIAGSLTTFPRAQKLNIARKGTVTHYAVDHVLKLKHAPKLGRRLAAALCETADLEISNLRKRGIGTMGNGSNVGPFLHRFWPSMPSLSISAVLRPAFLKLRHWRHLAMPAWNQFVPHPAGRFSKASGHFDRHPSASAPRA